MEPNFQDILGWSMDSDILKIINGETLYFSNRVHKYNSFNLKQERNLILTDKCLYNLKNRSAKRQMKYEEMLGITFSIISNEFVIHADKGYDFHFISPDKTIIIYIIAKCYEKLLKKPIILCEVKEKSLKQYVTTKKDKKKDINISKLDKNNIIDTQTYIIDNDPIEINKRSLTEVSGRQVNILSLIQENEKDIISEAIFINNENIKRACFGDFNIIKILGRGVSGKIFLVQNKYNNLYYALRCVDKNIYNVSDIKISLIKKLTKNIDFPFLININFCFETNNKIYFAFPYIEGEELYYALKKNKNFDEYKIKFYAGIIGLTLDYLHNHEIQSKSFNTRNIFVDKDGYLQIVPFHIGKIFPIKDKTNNKILDKYKDEYSAPEIFSEDDSQNLKTADWWNLGAIIYEMIYDIPPFFAYEKEEMKNAIINNKLKFPINPEISESLKDLVSKLLNKKVEERLGYKNGFEEIKKHDFFKDFDFEELKEKKIEAPYKPTIGDILQNNKKIEEKFTYEDLKKSGILNKYHN